MNNKILQTKKIKKILYCFSYKVSIDLMKFFTTFLPNFY